MGIWHRLRAWRLPEEVPFGVAQDGDEDDSPAVEKTRITVMRYDPDTCAGSGAEERRGALIEEKEVERPDEIVVSSDESAVTWINVVGLQNIEVLEQLGVQFELHPLVIEDILNRAQRPKVEDYDTYLFFVLKSLYHVDPETHVPYVEQVSLVLGPNYILSFQEKMGDEFEPIREQMRSNGWHTRKLSADYLAYALMDLIVDQYFVVLEQFGDQIEGLQEELVVRPTRVTLHGIYRLKREIAFLRRAIWPLREVVAGLERMDSVLIQKSTEVYLRDVYDHTIQILDAVETSRDMLSGMLDIYLSSVSNRMNEVMKLLTVISTIFIPLTFITGVYGMNFRFMPELNSRWGYPVTWGIMIALAVGMIVYFKRKKWL